MVSIYLLEHIYEVDETNETKFISAFSATEKAEQIIEILYKENGFKNHPKIALKLMR